MKVDDSVGTGSRRYDILAGTRIPPSRDDKGVSDMYLASETKLLLSPQPIILKENTVKISGNTPGHVEWRVSSNLTPDWLDISEAELVSALTYWTHS